MLNIDGNLIKENTPITKELVDFAKANNYKFSLKTGDYNKVGFKRNILPYNLTLLKQIHYLYTTGNLYLRQYLEVIGFSSVGVFINVLKRHGFEIPTLKQIHKLYKDQILEYSKQQAIQKYGVEHHLKSPEVREKINQTVRDVYGVDYITQSEEVKNKTRETVRLKYGVDHISQSEAIQGKARSTCVKRYGASKPFQSPGVQKKIKDNNVECYGVSNPMQVPEISRRSRRNRVSNDPRAQELERCYEVIEQADDSQRADIFDFVSGSFRDSARLKHLRGLDLKPENYSEPENSLRFLLEPLNNKFIHNAKKAHGVRKPNDEYYEMDFYYPELKLGFEVNGLAYHSTNVAAKGDRKAEDYHFRKFLKFHESGIKMISFSDYELEKFRDDVIIIIKYHLNLLQNFTEDDKPEVTVSKEFLEFNKISNINESLNYGLFDESLLSDNFENHQHQRFIKEYEYYDCGVIK